MMSVLLVMGFIAAKAANGNPPELILVSQPVIVYNYNSVTVCYDVQNIGDVAYKGDICIYLDPDDGTEYAYKRIKVCPGKIKRVSLDIMAYRLDPSVVYTIMPYYEMGEDLFSFTTFEYFEPIRFSWNGPRDATWIVTVLPPRPRFYTWPGDYRFYYDGFMPPMPPPVPGPGPGPGPGPLPPPDPHHHTYDYHHHNGGYPGGNTPPPGPTPGGGPGGGGNHDGNHHDGASVRPSADGGSMSHGNDHSGNNSGTGGSNSNVTPSAPNNNHNGTNGSNSGRTGNSNVNRPSNESGTHTGTTPAHERSGSGNISRPSGNAGVGAGARGAGARGGRGGGGRRR